jgi:hypothetical protein
MELKKLVERLEQLTGEQIPENTVKKWAHTEKIIPTPIGGGKGGRVSGGRARKADWPAPALEQAAAVWWVRKKYRGMDCKEKKKLSKDQINVIKRAASVLDEDPFAIYHLPNVTGPLSTQHIAPEAITMTFVSDDFNGVNLFPGKKLQEKIRCLNTLLIAWVAAREKVRAWAYKGMSATYILEHYPELHNLMPSQIDFSKIDPWLVDLPCPWRIDRPARIVFLWRSHPPISENDTDWKFDKWIPPMQTKLEELGASVSSDDDLRDELVLYENGVDTREFFRIDVGDRKGWARDELEKKKSELKEVEYELRSLGVDPSRRGDISYNWIASIETGEVPFDSLTEREKRCFELAEKWFGLTYSLVRLESDFSAKDKE